MKPLIPEIEERYGAARSILLPVVVTRPQLEMLRAAEKESEEGWNFMLLLFGGARLVAQIADEQSHAYRLPEFRLAADILDLEDFEVAFKAKVQSSYGLKVEFGRYLLMAQCTFMATGEAEDNTGDDLGTSSRTLHIFTARTHNLDDLTEENQAGRNAITLVKPTALLDALQAEWADYKTQLAFGGTMGDMRTEYDKSWTMVRLRVVATAFQRLFGWPLPEL